MLDLRAIFDRFHIPWRDKGANCSVGNVSIPCPFCGNDPSFHCAVEESGQGYFCFRNRKHQGGITFLFKKLHIPLSYVDRSEHTYVPPTAEALNCSAFQFFEPAEQSTECLLYLRSRGFSIPTETCRKFNLKYEREGKWAGRLIIPLTVGWTGRSMRPNLLPRYLAHTDEAGVFLYGKSSSAILLEGPLDGMRIASITGQFTVIAAGGLGRILSPVVILYLKQQKFSSLYFLPDNGTPASQISSDLREVRSYLPYTNVGAVQVPPPHKDPAEMLEEELSSWLVSLTLKHGQAHGRGMLETIV